MSSKMSKNKKKKLKKKAKKVAEIREIQMQQLAEVEMREQLTAGSSCPRFGGDYDEEEEERCVHRNGTERLSAVDEEYAESADHKNHISSLIASSCHDICNGHHYKSQSIAVPNELDIDGETEFNNESRNRLERSESTLVPNYHKSKEMGMRRVASCPGITALFETINHFTNNSRIDFQTDQQKMMDRSPDPSHENCDISVKIADLGNACWEV